MKIGKILSIALSLVFVSVLAHAETFVVGVENIDYYPFYSGVDGQYKGFARDVIDAFAKSKGYTIKYQPLPIKRLYKDFFSGNVDFKFPDNSFWSADQRKGKDITYSSPVVGYIDGVMVLPDKKGTFSGGINTLGIISGFTAWDYLGDIKAGKIKVEESNNYSSLLKKAMRGRIDAAYSNTAVAEYQLRDVLKKPGGLVFDDSLPHTKSNYFLSTTKHKKVMDEFNAFMKENAGLIQNLKKKYMIESY